MKQMRRVVDCRATSWLQARKQSCTYSRRIVWRCWARLVIVYCLGKGSRGARCLCILCVFRHARVVCCAQIPLWRAQCCQLRVLIDAVLAFELVVRHGAAPQACKVSSHFMRFGTISSRSRWVGPTRGAVSFLESRIHGSHQSVRYAIRGVLNRWGQLFVVLQTQPLREHIA